MTRVIDATDTGRTTQSDYQRFVLPAADPAAHDPFIALVEDWFSDAGFPWHPHRGFQTLTLVIDGQLEHQDNAGGAGVLGPGDAQWMVAGRYALHSELAHRRRPVHTLQAWINLPPELKLTDTSYRDLRAADAALLRGPGLIARVHDLPAPYTLLDARLEAGTSFTHELPGDNAAFAYVVSGTLELADGRALAAQQSAWFDAGDEGPTAVELQATADAHVVAYSGRPIGAPVVCGGPFVMNTQEEIEQAFDDFRNGRFGPIPGS